MQLAVPESACPQLDTACPLRPTSSRPGIIAWLRMTGLRRLGLQPSQYSRASMFTLRWSMPSWQMSACGGEEIEAGRVVWEG